MSILKVKL